MTQPNPSTRTRADAAQPKGKPTPSEQPKGKPARSAKPTRSAPLTRLLRRKTGASMAQVQAAFGWQPHTVRAAISAQRKAGHWVERTPNDTGPVYRIVTDEAKP
ncbi:DUF3489 domain-containing protein [Aestuariibius insulae]|uniref:DUF3489 domain-containing protein n=1 Tax=Aestuariibius insulae TaxID=2058287 RepID=UPI00345ECE97